MIGLSAVSARGAAVLHGDRDNNSNSNDATITGLIIQEAEGHISDWLKAAASCVLLPVLDALLAAGTRAPVDSSRPPTSSSLGGLD